MSEIRENCKLTNGAFLPTLNMPATHCTDNEIKQEQRAYPFQPPPTPP